MKKHGIVTIKTVNGLDVVSDFAPFWLEGSVINFELNGIIDPSLIKAVHANFYFRETKAICIPVALLGCDTASDSGNTVISADLREISMFYRRAGEKLDIISCSHTNKILATESKKNGPDDGAMEEDFRDEKYACCF